MDENARLHALHRYEILDTSPESDFDDIARIAALIAGVPVATLAFVDQSRSWFKAVIGLDYMQVPKKTSFAHVAIEARVTIVVNDLTLDPRFSQNPNVAGGSQFRFHAGVPLFTSDQQVIGVLSVFGFKPHSLRPDQIAGLEGLARVTMQILEARVLRKVEVQQKDAALEKQTEFLNVLLESLSEGIVACDADGHLTVFNRATREFHGLDSNGTIPPEEWANYYRLFHADGVTKLNVDEIPLRRAFSGEQLSNSEMVVVTNDGKKRNLLCTGRAMFDKNQNRLGAVVTLRDISQEKQDRLLIEEKSRAFKALIDVCPVGIALMGTDRTLKLWNPAAEKMFGYRSEDVLGKYLPYIREHQIAESNALLDTFLASSQRHQIEVVRYRKDDTKVDVQLSIEPVISASGKVDGIMVVFVDISDLKEREKNLRSANHALKDASVAKSEFLANMSHEIRTPINGVIAMAELVLLGQLSDEQRKHIEIMQQSANGLLSVIGDILDFSKIEAGKLSVDEAAFSLKDVIREVVQTVALQADEKGLRLTAASPELTSAKLIGDASRLRQILLNLVGNAVKFTSSGDVHLSVSLSSEAGTKAKVRFEVQDTGVGMSEKTISRLFQPFAQADSSTTKLFGGTGLGLSISKRLVDLMGGTINVESELGVGSKFWFEVELGVELTAPVQIAVSAEATAMYPNLKVLLVEDNPVNQLVASKLLRQIGIVVEVAENGQQAVDAVRKTTYDLVLMDCQMPVMDGYVATQTIRADGSIGAQPTIVALTANAMKGDREKCLDAGMTDYISKPVRLNDFKAILQKYFASSEERAS